MGWFQKRLMAKPGEWSEPSEWSFEHSTTKADVPELRDTSFQPSIRGTTAGN